MKKKYKITFPDGTEVIRELSVNPLIYVIIKAFGPVYVELLEDET